MYPQGLSFVTNTHATGHRSSIMAPTTCSHHGCRKQSRKSTQNGAFCTHHLPKCRIKTTLTQYRDRKQLPKLSKNGKSDLFSCSISAYQEYCDIDKMARAIISTARVDACQSSRIRTGYRSVHFCMDEPTNKELKSLLLGVTKKVLSTQDALASPVTNWIKDPRINEDPAVVVAAASGSRSN